MRRNCTARDTVGSQRSRKDPVLTIVRHDLHPPSYNSASTNCESRLPARPVSHQPGHARPVRQMEVCVRHGAHPTTEQGEPAVATTLERPSNTTATTTEFVRRASDMPILGKTRNANLAPAALYERAMQDEEGILAA